MTGVETLVGVAIGAILIAGAFALAGRQSKPREAQITYLPPSPMPSALPAVQGREPMKPVLDANGAVIMQGVAQQVSSLGRNEAFDIDLTWTDTGQKLRFSRVDLPTLVRPMQLAPEQLPGGTDKLAKMEKNIRKIRQAMERMNYGQAASPTPEKLEVDGIPCVLKKTDSGYDLMQIMPNGSLRLMAQLGAKL